MKTLKDFKLHIVKEEYQELEGIKGNLIEEDELKAEAIKWVKAMDKVKIQGSIDWKVVFKNFHNISEEDLKGEITLVK